MMYWRDILFDAECPVCRRKGVRSGLCETCAGRITEAVKRERVTLSDGEGHTLCGVSAMHRTADVERLLLYFKHNTNRALLAWCARMGLYALSLLGLPKGTLFVSVPRSGKGYAENGFDHAERLARAMAKMDVNGGIYAPLLCRRNASAGQKLLTERDREKRMNGSIALSGRRLPPQIPAVVIIDDLYTAGATLFACEKALRTALPDTPIFFAVLARGRGGTTGED